MSNTAGNISVPEAIYKIQQLSSMIPRGRMKYFHQRSLENFAAGLDRIDSQNDRQWIVNQLSEYCDYCIDHFDEIDNLNESKAIYFAHLSKVAAYYDKHLKFTVLITPVTLVFIYGVLFLCLMLFLKWYIALAISLLFLSFHFIYLLKKKRNGEVYQLYY